MKVALPAGELRQGAAQFITAAGVPSEDYSGGSRTYRPTAANPEVRYRVFRDADIPIQVALGNYDAGICSGLAVDELISRFPAGDIVKLSPLPFGGQRLLAVGAQADRPTIVSQYPNLAERFALNQRMARYRVVAVNGAAANYPPEDADIAVLALSDGEEARLPVVAELGASTAWLIANRQSLSSVDLSPLMQAPAHSSEPFEQAIPRSVGSAKSAQERLRLALPDGHQQREAPEICRRAGLKLDGYDETEAKPRPLVEGEEIGVKVIRPQDMPQMVALGAFDLAITGRDCLRNHLAQFPSSPVVEVADLLRQRYRWAAVIHRSVGADHLPAALKKWRSEGRQPLRIASEYVNLADQFARERHLGRYRVIPVVGASEGFVPEDAEMLIEGSETGYTWRANDLIPAEWLFESTMIVVAHRDRAEKPNYNQVEALSERLAKAA